MIKKTLTYQNFAGETVSEDHEFHISKAEFGRMELSAEGNSMTEYLKRIGKAQSGREIIAVMEQIVEKSYGVRTPDGKGFDKHPDHLRAFKASGAYDALFEELLLSPDAERIAAEFVKGLFPADWAAQVPTDPAQIRAAADEVYGRVPAGVKMPTDRRAKHSAEPVVQAPQQVPFEGQVIEAPKEESVEELRARLAAAEAAAQQS